ncbi:MAG: CHAT domain-containing protein, partial [Bacteroidia bacterium]|nr:CHAT domain-containing protein [Bacteroidia bacterium]
LHSQILGALGNLYRQTNRFSEAYEYYQTASKIVKGIDFKTYFAAEFDKNSLVCQRLLEGDKLFLLLSRMEAKSNIDPENCCVENYERLAAEAKSANAIDLEFLSYSNMYYFIENNTDKIEITGGKKEQIEEHILRTSFEVVKLKAETYIQKQALVYIIDLYSAKLDRSRSLIVIEGIVSQLTSIEEIVKKNYNPQQVCEFELLIGSARTRIKIEVNRAIDNFKEALRLRPTTGPGSQEKLSFIVSKLVELLTYKGDYDKARSIISFCLDQKIGNKAEWFMVAGNIEDEQGNYNNAFECYSNSKLVEERTHDDYLKALILYNESFVYRNVGEFGKSQNNLFQCLDILGDELFSMIGFKEQHPIPPISSYLEYYMKKDMEFLVQYSSNKYSNPGKLNNTLNYIINCYDELGKNYMGINDLVMARSFFERSSKLFQRLNAKLFIGFKTVYGSVETTLNLVKISLAESDTSAARGYFKYYHEKLRSADVDLERPFLKSDFSLLEAYYYMSLNNYQEAKRLGLEALRLTEEYNLADKRLETLALLFRITTHLKENSESDYYFISITKALKDFIPSIFPGLGENEKLAFITKAEDYSDLLGSFVLKESTRNPQLKIWYSDYILFYKKLVLSNVVSLKKNILESDDPILGNLYDEYMGVRNDLQKLYVFRDNSNSGLKPKVDSLNNRIVELERQLSFKSEEFASSIDTTITWNKIRDELKENEALIEFIRIKNLNQPGSQDSTLYAALITRPGVKYPEFIPLCGDDQLFRTLYDIEAPNERRFRLETTDEILATQYQLIWKPMEKILSGVSKIYLSTTGWLNSVSFQALKKYENSYLIDSLEIYYLLSSREFVSKRFQNEPKKPFTAALFGGIVYDLDSTFMIRDAKRGGIESNQSYLPESDSRSNRSFGYLQGTRNEIIKVNNFLSGRNCKTILFTDTLATERQFKKLTGKEAPEILHIATHGFYLQPGIKKDQKPNVFNIGPEFLLADDALKRSGLAMAGANLAWKGMKLPGGVEDGILTAYEVSNMDLRNTGLVLLSACETGLGDMQNSEGVFGLQRAFRKAGAQAVIMSLWNVDDQSTAQLMSKFFELWMKGASRAVAFNLAVKELRREYSGEPSKWAAFVLVN